MDNILKHIPYYPDSNDPKISYKMSQLKEFNELKLRSYENLPLNQGEPLFSQEIQKRYYSSNTKNDSGLFVHVMGTGKSCLVDFIIENLKSPFKKPAVIIVSNANLVMSFQQEIVNRCTSGVYDVEVEMKTGMTQEDYKKKKRKKIKKALHKTYKIGTRTEILDPLANMSPEAIQEAFSNIEIIVDEVHHYTTTASEGGEPKHYDNLFKLTHNITNSRVLLLSGTPIWDKMHELAPILNLILPLDKQLPTGGKFKKMFLKDGKIINENIFLDAIRGKVSFLRAMEDVIERRELGVSEPWFEHLKVYPIVMSDFQEQVYQSLASSQALKKGTKGLEKSPSGKEGYELWTDTELNDLIMDVGLRSGKSYKGTKLIKLLGKKPTQEEQNIHKKERAALISLLRRVLMPDGLKRDLLEASSFVFPVIKNGEVQPEGSYGTKGFENNLVLESNKKIKQLKEFYRYKNRNVINYIRDDLKEYSGKLAFIADYVKAHPDEVIFVYNEYVTGGAGVINYSVVMDSLLNDDGTKAFHWVRSPSELRSNPDNQVRFITISSNKATTNSEYDIDDMIDTISSPQNATGKLCQIIFGSGKIAEGLTIKNVRTFIANVPHWNESKLDQAQYRAYRVGALANIQPPEGRYLNVILLASVLKGKINSKYVYPEGEKISIEDTVDIDVYKLAESKDLENAQLYRLLKKGSWDCALNYERNVLEQDKNGSRVCNYQDCNYVCDGFPESMIDKSKKVWKYNPKPILDHNYSILYLKHNVEKVVDNVFSVFKDNLSITYEELLKRVGCSGYKDALTVTSTTECWIVDLAFSVYELFRGSFILKFSEIKELIITDKEEPLLMVLSRIIDMKYPLVNKYGFKSYLDEEHSVFFLKEFPNDKGVLSSFYSQFPIICDKSSLETLQEVSVLHTDNKKLSQLCKSKPIIESIESLSYRSRIVLYEDLAMRGDIDLADKIFPNQLKIDQNGNKFHQLYVLESKGLEYGKMSKSLNISGLRRVLVGDMWRYATPLEEQELINILKVEKEEKKESLEGIENQELAQKIGHIGIISKGVFSIKKLSKRYAGKNIISWKKEDLYGLIWITNAYPPAPSEIGKGKSKKELIEMLETQQSYINLYGGDFENLKSLDINRLRSILHLITLNSEGLSEIIKTWFIEHNIVRYEK